jgi:hypothetical protein
VNTEELERSLRSEFENYLKDVIAEMRGGIEEFQKTFENEFQKHKDQTDEAFRALAARFERDVEFDPAFVGSVVEHLRLARDEGAEMAATAFSEAEKLEAETTVGSSDAIKNAVKDISSQASQLAILSSLVDHAANFAPRGAFFIVKQGKLNCWRTFGGDPARDLSFEPFSKEADTVIGKAVSAPETIETSFGSCSEDELYLRPLGFGEPDRMYAFPLVVRGVGVAVLYADFGIEGVRLDADALDSIVRVAGLSVELLAASQAAAAAAVPGDPAHPYDLHAHDEPEASEPPAWPVVEEAAEYGEHREEMSPSEPAFSEVSETVSYRETEFVYEVEQIPGPETFVEEAYSDQVIPAAEETLGTGQFATQEPIVEEYLIEPRGESESQYYPEPEQTGTPPGDFAFAPSDSFGSEPAPDTADTRIPEPEEAFETVSNGHSASVVELREPSFEPVAPEAVGRRLSKRSIDLPIEVAEEERKLHIDARKFARLLVSEINLYNEQKVAEGRQNRDLYDRLREAIDRSREMYEKRVKPEVAEKFDYFHFELVGNLAEGDEAKLGGSYPGSSV